MDAVLTIIFAAFIAVLGVAAQAWGVDSRPTLGDDHRH